MATLKDIFGLALFIGIPIGFMIWLENRQNAYGYRILEISQAHYENPAPLPKVHHDKKKKRKYKHTKSHIRIYNFREDTETQKNEDACTICLTNRKYITAYPCGHILFCGECAREFDDDHCVICRKYIEEFRGVYF